MVREVGIEDSVFALRVVFGVTAVMSIKMPKNFSKENFPINREVRFKEAEKRTGVVSLYAIVKAMVP